MEINTAISGYLAGLYLEFDDSICEIEAVSRSADFREVIQAHWETLNEEQRVQVMIADRNLVANPDQAAPFYQTDQTAQDRIELSMPEANWWWWLDRIAACDYPEKYLPEWVKYSPQTRK